MDAKNFRVCFNGKTSVVPGDVFRNRDILISHVERHFVEKNDFDGVFIPSVPDFSSCEPTNDPVPNLAPSRLANNLVSIFGFIFLFSVFSFFIRLFLYASSPVPVLFGGDSVFYTFFSHPFVSSTFSFFSLPVVFFVFGFLLFVSFIFEGITMSRNLRIFSFSNSLQTQIQTVYMAFPNRLETWKIDILGVMSSEIRYFDDIVSFAIDDVTSQSYDVEMELHDLCFGVFFVSLNNIPVSVDFLGYIHKNIRRNIEGIVEDSYPM